METLEKLQKRLDVLEQEIAETKRRLPAHSVKPPVMMELLAIEDEYDTVLEQIARIKKQASVHPKLTS